jgi:Fe-S cluster assembly protein SufD
MLEGPSALHMKGTLVTQAAVSSYKLTEARLGGRLSRQDISILQARPPLQSPLSD